MKCVIVQASTIERYRRIDAEYYVGTEVGKKVVRAEMAVKAAVARLRRARRNHAEVEARSAALLADGVIVPMAPWSPR